MLKYYFSCLNDDSVNSSNGVESIIDFLGYKPGTPGFCAMVN